MATSLPKMSGKNGLTLNIKMLVYNPFLVAVYDTIKCEDSISLSYQSADSSQSKDIPPPPIGGGQLSFKL